MRKFLHLLWLIAAPFLMGSCSNDDDFQLEPSASFSAVTLFSKHSNAGYIPIGQASDMKIYSGDTLRYLLTYTTNQGVESFKAYDNIRGREFPLIINGSVDVSGIIHTAQYELEYIVDGEPGQEITLTFEGEDVKGVLYKDPETGKVPEIKFTIGAPLVYQNAKLYNYWGDKSNSLVILDFAINNAAPQTLVSEQYASPWALVTNKMPVRDWYDNRFEHGFSSGEITGNRQAYFVKVPDAAKNWHQPNQIALAMEQYGPATPGATNVQVGDIYAFKVRYPFSDSWVIYGTIEVKNIVDDGGDTVRGTGHDEDYMELDIKYYPGYRY